MTPKNTLRSTFVLFTKQRTGKLISRRINKEMDFCLPTDFDMHTLHHGTVFFSSHLLQLSLPFQISDVGPNGDLLIWEWQPFQIPLMRAEGGWEILRRIHSTSSKGSDHPTGVRTETSRSTKLKRHNRRRGGDRGARHTSEGLAASANAGPPGPLKRTERRWRHSSSGSHKYRREQSQAARLQPLMVSVPVASTLSAAPVSLFLSKTGCR